MKYDKGNICYLLAVLVLGLTIGFLITSQYYKETVRDKTANLEKQRFVQEVWYVAGYVDGREGKPPISIVRRPIPPTTRKSESEKR